MWNLFKRRKVARLEAIMTAILEAVGRIEVAVAAYKTARDAEVADLKAKLADAEARAADAADNPAAVARLDAVTASVTPTP